MSWTTCRGHKIDYALYVFQSIEKRMPAFGSPKDEKGFQWMHAYDNVANAAMALDSELLVAKSEIARLKAENDFMLRLINAHMEEVKDANKT